MTPAAFPAVAPSRSTFIVSARQASRTLLAIARQSSSVIVLPHALVVSAPASTTPAHTPRASARA
jgi:hypothetical protein